MRSIVTTGFVLAALLAACGRQEAGTGKAAATGQQAQPATAATAAQAAQAAPARPAEGFGRLTIDQVADQLGKPGVYVFDNNSADEYVEGHVPTAKWVAYNDYQASELPADKDATLIFYCHNEH